MKNHILKEVEIKWGIHGNQRSVTMESRKKYFSIWGFLMRLRRGSMNDTNNGIGDQRSTMPYVSSSILHEGFRNVGMVVQVE